MECESLFAEIGDRFHISEVVLQEARLFFQERSVQIGRTYTRKWRELAAFSLYREMMLQNCPSTLREVAYMFGVEASKIYKMGLLICPDMCHRNAPSQYFKEVPYFLGMTGRDVIAVGEMADKKFQKICSIRQMHPKSILGICIHQFMREVRQINVSLKQIAGLLNISTSCLKRNKMRVLRA